MTVSVNVEKGRRERAISRPTMRWRGGGTGVVCASPMERRAGRGNPGAAGPHQDRNHAGCGGMDLRAPRAGRRRPRRVGEALPGARPATARTAGQVDYPVWIEGPSPRSARSKAEHADPVGIGVGGGDRVLTALSNGRRATSSTHAGTIANKVSHRGSNHILAPAGSGVVAGEQRGTNALDHNSQQVRTCGHAAQVTAV